MDKNNLIKLVDFINELSDINGNEWLKKELLSKLSPSNNSPSLELTKMEEIYEYCLQQIIKEHAEKFYSEFKLNVIKQKLVDDFIRMEKFRREDNFEDFCLALFQQIEGIINALITDEIQKMIIDEKNTLTHKTKNKINGLYESQKLWQLIFPFIKEEDLLNKLSKSIYQWDFTERYRVILFIYYFNKKIYNYQDFQTIFFLGNELYQSRNLNHRGGKTTDNQKKTIDKVTSNSHRYYFKFMGFLEEFSNKINSTI
jgi:hypothetical protein